MNFPIDSTFHIFRVLDINEILANEIQIQPFPGLHFLYHQLQYEKNSGFTALELATTIAIVAVIAALIMPPYLKWNRSRRLEDGRQSPLWRLHGA